MATHPCRRQEMGSLPATPMPLKCRPLHYHVGHMSHTNLISESDRKPASEKAVRSWVREHLLLQTAFQLNHPRSR
jgi:hypothetical protein